MARFFFNEAQKNEYQLEVSVGALDSFHGQTRVTLVGDGTFTAIQERATAGTKQEHEGSDIASKPRVKKGEFVSAPEIFKSLARFDWPQSFPSRPGIPDEAIISWQVSQAGNPLISTRLWIGEAEHDPLIGPILQQLRSTAGSLSDNTIYL